MKTIRQIPFTDTLPAVDQNKTVFWEPLSLKNKSLNLTNCILVNEQLAQSSASRIVPWKALLWATLFPLAPAGPCTKHIISDPYPQAAQGNLTWVSVQVTLYSFPNTLQFNSLKGLIPMHDCWQAAQSIVNQICHFSYIKELQKFRVYRWEWAEKHSLEEKGNNGQSDIAVQFWHL